VLSNGSLSSSASNESDIRKRLVEADLVDCIVSLPPQLFYNTGIPACLWFISRKKTGNGDRKRVNEVLFIDAGELGYMEDRTHKAFKPEHIDQVADTYHEWRTRESKYKNIKGFCKSATLEDIQKHKYILTPGRYVGIPDEEDDGIPFQKKMLELKKTLSRNIEQGKQLDKELNKQLAKIGFKL